MSMFDTMEDISQVSSEQEDTAKIREWKFCREFQRTVDEVKCDLFKNDNDGFDADRKICEAAKATMTDDFIEKTKGEVLLQSVFNAWREEAIGDAKLAKIFKADCFARFVRAHSHFRRWRLHVRELKQERFLEELEAEEQRQKEKWMRAMAFNHRRLTSKYMVNWRTFTRLMVAKRQLRSLEIKKEKSVEKVNSFLKNLDSIKTAKRRSGANPTSHQDQPFQTPNNPTRTSKLREQMIAGANRVPTVPDSPSRRKRKPLELQIKENQIEHQKLVIESQRSRLKQQQREIEDLKKMTNQLDQGKGSYSGRAVTNWTMYKSLQRKTRQESRSPMKALDLTKLKPEYEVHARDLLDMKSTHAPPVGTIKNYVQQSVSQALGKRTKSLRNIVISEDGSMGRKAARPKSADSVVALRTPSPPDSSQPFYINVEINKRAPNNLQAHRNVTHDMEDAMSYYSSEENVKISPDPDFVINMKLRQQERARKREGIRKFHQSKEAERARLSAEAEANRIRSEREEKERAKEERLELRRKIKAKEEFKLKRKEQLLKLRERADEFSKIYQKRVWFRMWREHMKSVQLKCALAEIHHRAWLKRTALRNWKVYSDESVYEYTLQVSRAAVHYLHKILRMTFRHWRELMAVAVRKSQTADDFNDRRICLTSIRAWWLVSEKEIHIRRVKEKRAYNFWARKMKRWTFDGWVRLLKERNAIAGREALKIRLENKVLLDVPDYIPFSIRTSSNQQQNKKKYISYI